MLLQGDEKEMVLLPAIPATWKEGEVRGLRARGGYTVDMKWLDGKPHTVTVTASKKGKVKLSYKDKQITLKMREGETRQVHLFQAP